QARLNVDNKELLLRPGMTATVEIVTREANDVLLAPAAAFRFTPPTPQTSSGGWSLTQLFNPARPPMRMGQRPSANARGGEGRPVYVLRDGAPQQVRVVTGATDGDMIEVSSGL